jgi:hypothetical protein
MNSKYKLAIKEKLEEIQKNQQDKDPFLAQDISNGRSIVPIDIKAMAIAYDTGALLMEEFLLLLQRAFPTENQLEIVRTIEGRVKSAEEKLEATKLMSF